MATQTGVRATSKSGAAPPLQTRRRNDRSDQIVFQEINHAPMMTRILKGGQKKVSGDPKYFMMEQDYETFEFELTGALAAGTSTTLTTNTTYVYVANIATILQPGDVVHLPAQDSNQVTAAGTVIAAGEMLLIEEITGVNSARVIRGGGEGGNARNAATTSTNTITSYLASNANAEGSSARTALSDQLTEDYNYTEIHRLSWHVSGTLDATDLYGGPDQQIEARQKRRSFVRNLERSFWFGHRYIRYSNGKPQRYSGGMLEYLSDTNANGTRVAVYDSTKDLVTGDATQRMWKAGTNWTVDNFNKFCQQAFKFGNRTKTGYAGPGFLTIFENKMRPFVRMEWTTNSFGIEVARYKSSHGVIEFVPEPEFYGEYVNDLVVLDDQYHWFRFLRGRDIQVKMNIENNDEDAIKHELFAEIGPDQKFRSAHSWLTAGG